MPCSGKSCGWAPKRGPIFFGFYFFLSPIIVIFASIKNLKETRMKNFESQEEAIDLLMEKMEGLPEEKVALFCLNFFGAADLLVKISEELENIEDEFKNEEEVDRFIAGMLS